jgi:hypothetical protein
MTAHCTRLPVLLTSLALMACTTAPQRPPPAEALEANITALRAAVAQHQRISPAPLPRFDTLVLARKPHSALPSIWLLDQAAPIGPYAVLGERHPSGQRKWNWNKLFAPGVGVELGEVNYRAWHHGGYQYRDGQLLPAQIGSQTTLRVQDERWGFDQSYEIKVVGQLVKAPGFEWLDDTLFVHAIQHTFKSRDKSEPVISNYVRLYSPKLAWHVYEGSSNLAEAPSWRAVGAMVDGQNLGIPASSTQPQPMLAAMTPALWVESPLRKALTGVDAQTRILTRPSAEAHATQAKDIAVTRTTGSGPSTVEAQTRVERPAGTADMWCPALVKVASAEGSNHWVMYVSPTFQVPVAALVSGHPADTHAVAFARHVKTHVQRAHTWIEDLRTLQCGYYIPGALQFHPKTREAFIENQRSQVLRPHRFTAVDVDWVPPGPR